MFIFKFYIRHEGKLLITISNGYSLMHAFDRVTARFKNAGYVNHYQVK